MSIFIGFELLPFDESEENKWEIFDFSQFKHSSKHVPTNNFRITALPQKQLNGCLNEILQLVFLENKTLAFTKIDLQKFKARCVLSHFIQRTHDMLLVLHPKCLMNLIIKIKTQQLTVTQSYGLSSVIIDILPYKCWPILVFYQFLVLIMRFYHIALQILHYQLQQLYPFLSKTKFKVLVYLTHELHIVVHTICIVAIVEKTFHMKTKESQHYCVDQHHHVLVTNFLSPTQSLVNWQQFLRKDGIDPTTYSVLFCQFHHNLKVLENVLFSLISSQFLNNNLQLFLCWDLNESNIQILVMIEEKRKSVPDPLSKLHLFLQLFLKQLACPQSWQPLFILFLNFLFSFEEVSHHVVNILNLIFWDSQGHHFFLDILNSTNILFVFQQFCQQSAAN